MLLSNTRSEHKNVNLGLLPNDQLQAIVNAIKRAVNWSMLAWVLGFSLIRVRESDEAVLTISTRNIKHFEPTGVSVVNPFDYQG